MSSGGNGYGFDWKSKLSREAAAMMLGAAAKGLAGGGGLSEAVLLKTIDTVHMTWRAIFSVRTKGGADTVRKLLTLLIH